MADSVAMEESAFESENPAPPDADITDIDLARPSFQHRSQMRASLRRRGSRHPTAAEYGTFENAAFGSDELGDPDNMVETTFTGENQDAEATVLRIHQTRKKPSASDRVKMHWKQFRLKVKDFFSVFGVSQRIQCFGGGVYSYFNFVSWLCKLNFFTSFFYLGALILPYAFVRGPTKFDDTVPTNNTSVDWGAALNCSTTYESDLNSYIEKRKAVADYAIDILQGTGPVELARFIFIGSYFDKILWQHDEDFDVRYDASLAFYLCLWVTLGLSLIVTIFVSGQRILKRMSVQEDNSSFTFKVLTRWDFIIQDQKRAKVEKLNIYRELKTSLDEEERVKRKNEMSAGQRRLLLLKRSAVWCSYFILLAGCLTSIYFANIKSLELSATFKDDTNSTNVLQLFYQYLPSIVIVVANLIVANYCRKIVAVEQYNANREIIITIWRTVILRFASLVILMISIFTLLRECFRKSQSASNECTGNLEKCKKAPCWETYIGQQFYKLVVLDLIVFVCVILLDLFKKLVGKKFKSIQPEFDIANNVLDLVYSQTLCWLGMFFCPLLPIVTFVKLLLLYYVRKILVVSHIYEHNEKSANAAQTDSYFLDILLFSLILVTILPLAVATSLFSPSLGCGPYRVARQKEGDRNSIQSRAVVNLPGEAQRVYTFIDSLIVMAPVWILFAFFIYYYYTLSKAREHLKKVLMEQMTLEIKDLAYCRNQVKYAKRAVELARRAQAS